MALASGSQAQVPVKVTHAVYPGAMDGEVVKVAQVAVPFPGGPVVSVTPWEVAGTPRCQGCVSTRGADTAHCDLEGVGQ